VKAAGILTLVVAGILVGACGERAPGDRPNILWITSEDNGQHLGAYGDAFAGTPNLDRLASHGMIYSYAWSNAPVCAPARTAIISGMYPTGTGSEHMRSLVRLPGEMKFYPGYLREAGYYCTNNVKEDFNLEKPDGTWDESSDRAHWRNRRRDQPFFSIFNFTTTHEGQIRSRPHTPVSDPARVPIPAYHPDTPEVRADWAQYYDMMTAMDARAGEVLDELAADGLAEDTIVFYYGDHGPGMPRSKRWPYDSGLRVPLIVHIPEKFLHLAPPEWRAGSVSDRMVAFVDLGPTVLSLAGLEPPGHMQGRPFLGEYRTPDPEYLHGFRGRMDERYDLVRSVRDTRYVYIRNYMPHRIYGQFIHYMFETPTTQAWKRLFDEGKLEPPQTYFWEPKAPEELYDLETDPDEVNNLAGSPEHRAILERLRGVQREHALRIRDLGFLPEAEMHARLAGRTPYEMARDSEAYPLNRILVAAETASSLERERTGEVAGFLEDADGAVRYWGALGLLMLGQGAVEEHRTALRGALNDASPSVRVAAAEALGRFGHDGDAAEALQVLLELAPVETNGLYVSLAALNAIEYMGPRAAPAKNFLATMPRTAEGVPERLAGYVPRLLEKILEDLEGEQR
jgi:arylsulfatase A-like enzyme